jgi:hypothetical protein
MPAFNKELLRLFLLIHMYILPCLCVVILASSVAMVYNARLGSLEWGVVYYFHPVLYVASLRRLRYNSKLLSIYSPGLVVNSVFSLQDSLRCSSRHLKFGFACPYLALQLHLSGPISCTPNCFHTWENVAWWMPRSCRVLHPSRPRSNGTCTNYRQISPGLQLLLMPNIRSRNWPQNRLGISEDPKCNVNRKPEIQNPKT